MVYSNLIWIPIWINCVHIIIDTPWLSITIQAPNATYAAEAAESESK